MTFVPPEVYDRQPLSNERDVFTGEANFSYSMLDGDDYLLATGGYYNFANGNNGRDHIISNGGQGRYLGGADNDRIDIWWRTEQGSWINGNNGNDIIEGRTSGVIYRGGAGNDLLRVSAGDVWGDKGSDVFQSIGGKGKAIINDYTPGEDIVLGSPIGYFRWYRLGDQRGLDYYEGDDANMRFPGITDSSQITVVDNLGISYEGQFLSDNWSPYAV